MQINLHGYQNVDVQWITAIWSTAAKIAGARCLYQLREHKPMPVPTSD